MASHKRKNKIAKAGCGYNWFEDNPHLIRKQAKVELKQGLLFPPRPVEILGARQGNDKCPDCGENRTTDCIHGVLTFLCGASGDWRGPKTVCEGNRYLAFVTDTPH